MEEGWCKVWQSQAAAMGEHLCVNAGIHPPAPKKYKPDAKHMICAPLLCSGFPFGAPS